ncbi:hypothetical protein ACLI1C_19010 [Devosia sp. XGJD_8]|uniref:hypothetical protein n=1 Tax=Devosia sp. XGJD_8 TaxID=3391187 RepID=UPI0039850A81
MSGNQEDFQHVPLDRSFRELSSYASESDDVDLSKAFYVSDGIRWPELLQNYRVVILSEAGSGKTEELRTIAKKLRSEGKAAFFLRLENIPEHFSSAFDVGTEGEFDEWVASGSEGWVFLDSVDEARLRHPRDFELALRLLGEKLKLAFDRAHVFLSGRMSAWRPKTDLDRARAHLPFTEITKVANDDARNTLASADDFVDELMGDEVDDGDELSVDTSVSRSQKEKPKTSAPFRIVTLEGLSRDQVETFAAARGVNNTKAFGDAIERADAWSFATLPQDLEDLVASWLKRGAIGTRRTVMQDGVERRLKERDQERADLVPLTEAKALLGAKLLAAATTLGRNPAIQVPDGHDGLEGIAVDKVLSDWSPPERKALLERPIFDAAIYGAVRFHHRTVREYLAAEWLREMLAKPASRRAIEDMFFKTSYGVDIIVPVMRPILPWVSLYDDRIRERVLEIAPEVLFEGGDPASLPLPTRQEILAEVVEDLVPGHSPRAPTDFAAVQRFAHSDLSEDIRSLLRAHPNDAEAASFLLRMIWLGELKSLLPEAKEHALMANAGKYHRMTAIRAVHAVGSKEDMRDVRKAISREPRPPDREWVNEICDTLEGTDEEIDWLLQEMARAEPLAKYTVDHFQDGVTKLVERMPVDNLLKLLEGLYALLSVAPFVDARSCKISTRLGWLLHPGAAAVERLVRERHPASLTSVALSVMGMLPVSKMYDADIRDLKADFSKLVPDWPELNRVLVWAEVERARKDHEGTNFGPVTNIWQANSFEAFWRFSAEDFEYFIGEIAARREMDDKLVALSGAIDSYVQGERGPTRLKQLKSAVSGVPKLTARLELFLHPPKRDDEFSRQNLKWKKQAKARARREKDNLRKSREYIGQHLDTLRDPGFPNPNDVSKTLWYLHHQTRNKSEQKGKWTSGDWRSLVPEFGDEIARAYRDGAILHAHRATPKLRSEGAEANTTTGSTVLGLTGLAIEARETPDWPSSVSEPDAERAWLFAAHELNGFPDWFPSLYAKHKVTLAKLMMREMEFEITSEPEGGMHYIISDLAWSGKWAWPELGPSIFHILLNREPRNAETLNKLLQIVLASGVPDAEVLALAKKRAGDADTKHPVQWFAVWTGIEPAAAIPAFSSYIDGLSENRESVDVAMSYATHLFGDRHSDFPVGRTAFKEPQYLEQLYVLLHRHVHRSEDIDRANGEAYSPTLRDRAQSSRDAIFNLLNSISGKEAYIAMTNIAAGETNADTSKWIAYRALQRATQDADMDAWTPEQVREFYDDQERTPRNHRELFDLAVNHLLDIKDDMENGDTSVARVLLDIDQEEVMRNYFGHELERMSAGRYQISQEEELADEKRTDLRFHGVGISSPVPTELKIADKWTGPKLFERFENQLSGDYLRDRRSSRGIFLLVNRGKERQRWQLPDGTMTDFEGAVKALQDYWLVLSPKYPGVDELRVIGIDLSKRDR